MIFNARSCLVVAALFVASPLLAGSNCGFSNDKSATTKTTLVLKYNVSGCPALSGPAGAKARVCLEKAGTGRFVCQSFDRSNAPTVGTETGSLRFIGLTPGSKYRAMGYYAKKIGNDITWSMTNSVLVWTDS